LIWVKFPQLKANSGLKKSTFQTLLQFAENEDVLQKINLSNSLSSLSLKAFPLKNLENSSPGKKLESLEGGEVYL
jgi:hypothetical protein